MTEDKTTIVVLNDTDEALIVRMPPTNVPIEPHKMKAIFIEGHNVFLKIWKDNYILLSKHNPKKNVDKTP